MEQLKKVLTQDDTVLFVGSGMSLWSGLPTWGGLIEELARFLERYGMNGDLVRSEARKGDLLQAASYGFDKLTKQQIGEFIRAACRYGKALPHEIHRKIVSLGPRCFITTNYDDLIEQSLRKWCPDRFCRPPITNRQLTETAEIVHARAIDFIFKPHGDAGDSESVVLTREQYRQLLPQGERQAALDAVKMLLASRPVIYLGFGLRDPDFLYVRDLLANTYKGGTRDHYAIMADVSDQESEYWRRNYGIHLTSYQTLERPNGSRDHSTLLQLLDKLLERPASVAALSGFDPTTPETCLALARHAAALARVPKIDPELLIRVSAQTKPGARHREILWRYEGCPVERLLDDGPKRILITGLPGAGKTYALRRATARLAESLSEICLCSDVIDPKLAVVPILVDLKLYGGNLYQQIAKNLPVSLPLEHLTRFFPVKIFLDSFNEMPREYWESGVYESDFKQCFGKLGEASIVVGSRTADGLDDLGLMAFGLEQVDSEIARRELRRIGADLGVQFSSEVYKLLERPFYFQYVASGAIKLPPNAQPCDFYNLLFERINRAFASRFSHRIDLVEVLCTVAYAALDRGEEAFPLSELLGVLSQQLKVDALNDITAISASDVANWLVSSSLLIPYRGNRVAFVHQSVTEYLAATELAKRYVYEPKLLKQKLALTRWDQALFLTLSLLPSGLAENFLQDVINADFVLALRASKYLEANRDEVIAVLLDELPMHANDLGQDDHVVCSEIECDLPITTYHEPQLRKIIQCYDQIGGAAIQRLVSLKGGEVKQEFLPLIVTKSDDYNFCANGLGPALRPFVREEDVQAIAHWAEELDARTHASTENDETQGFISGAASLLAGLDLSIIRRHLLRDGADHVPCTLGEIVCEVLEDHGSTDALEFAGELLLRGVDRAAFAIHLIGFSQKDGSALSWDSFNTLHAVRLANMVISSSTDGDWALSALETLCLNRSDLGKVVDEIALSCGGLDQAALLYCVAPRNLSPIMQSLEKIVDEGIDTVSQRSLRLLSRIDITWDGHERFFVQLLQLRNSSLVSSLFRNSARPDLPGLGRVDIGPIEWWLDWMVEITETDNDLFLLESLGYFLADRTSPVVGEGLVAEFNKSDSRYRRVLSKYILRHISGISTDMLNDKALSFLLANLVNEATIDPWRGHLLSHAATEKFVEEQLLPLLRVATGNLRENLQQILREIGGRHGRRYLA